MTNESNPLNKLLDQQSECRALITYQSQQYKDAINAFLQSIDSFDEDDSWKANAL